MSPKTGRPPKENPKSTRLQVRVDKEILAKLDLCAELSNSNRSEIVRKGIEMVYAELNNKKE